MKYILFALLLGLSACVTSKYLRIGPEKASTEPTTTISSEAGSKIDRNHDGIVSSEEIDDVIGNPSTLSAFIWLVVTVLATIALTAIVSSRHKWFSIDESQSQSNIATPIYIDKTTIANKKEKRHVLRG
jgi:hypothetical protein